MGASVHLKTSASVRRSRSDSAALGRTRSLKIRHLKSYRHLLKPANADNPAAPAIPSLGGDPGPPVQQIVIERWLVCPAQIAGRLNLPAQSLGQSPASAPLSYPSDVTTEMIDGKGRRRLQLRREKTLFTLQSYHRIRISATKLERLQRTTLFALINMNCGGRHVLCLLQRQAGLSRHKQWLPNAPALLVQKMA
jgi:hypothetical protein